MARPERWSTDNVIGSRLFWRSQVARTGQLLAGWAWSWLWACPLLPGVPYGPAILSARVAAPQPQAFGQPGRCR